MTSTHVPAPSSFMSPRHIDDPRLPVQHEAPPTTGGTAPYSRQGSGTQWRGQASPTHNPDTNPSQFTTDYGRTKGTPRIYTDGLGLRTKNPCSSVNIRGTLSVILHVNRG
jgi:hypothetical protein